MESKQTKMYKDRLKRNQGLSSLTEEEFNKFVEVRITTIMNINRTLVKGLIGIIWLFFVLFSLQNTAGNFTLEIDGARVFLYTMVAIISSIIFLKVFSKNLKKTRKYQEKLRKNEIKFIQKHNLSEQKPVKFNEP